MTMPFICPVSRHQLPVSRPLTAGAFTRRCQILIAGTRAQVSLDSSLAVTFHAFCHRTLFFYLRVSITSTRCLYQTPTLPNYLDPACPLSSATRLSRWVSQASLNTSSENLFALLRERRRMARASFGESSRAFAKPSANCSAVDAWKPEKQC